MTYQRPSPDQLLVDVSNAEKKAARGKLKIFFGSNAGVGKTFAMLTDARKRAALGAKILVGYAEPHIRPDTEELLLGLDILPYKFVPHQGATLKEFDLDAALAKHPDILCVDELAHSNAPGPGGGRHPKRWQDVYELLDAGINVYTTLNVQHLESVNDIVQRITGVKVRETLPDHVFDEADEIELIDISPDKIVERLREGKVYKQQQAEQALKHFFNRGNLIALRELALRKTAERVDTQMLEARKDIASTNTWAASERILVCVGPSPSSAQLVRATKRLANGARAPWIAACVEKPAAAPLSPEARARLAQTLHLAGELGGRPITLSGQNVAEELLAFARQNNITKIVVGKPQMPRWREKLFGSVVDDIIRHSGSIDVYVIRHDDEEKPHPRPISERPHAPGLSYLWAALICIAATLLGMFVYHTLGDEGRRFSNTNALMIDLLAVLFIAVRFERGPATAASLFLVAAFDFTVVPPYYTFSVNDSQYLFTFIVMLLTALVISTLADRIRAQVQSSRNRERRTAALLSLSRELSAAPEKQQIVQAVTQNVATVFDGLAVVFIPNAKGELLLAAASRESDAVTEKEFSVIQWVFDHSEIAGQGTDTLPSSAGIYLPLKATRDSVGVLGLLEAPLPYDHERLRLLEAFANQSAIALERAVLADESRHAWERVEAEFLRNTLLSGVSHDLRTPLAAITGAASSIAESNDISPEQRTELARDIVGESERMERLINNLLDMTRLEAGGFSIRKEWHSLDEIIGTAIHATRKRLASHPLNKNIPANLPLIHIDGIAIEQVIANLLENAANYTPAGTPIEINASASPERITIDIADHGPGLPPADPNSVFQKFFRGGPNSSNKHSDDGSRRGVGLGLAICKGIVQLHHGTITAENRDQGGALFRITLPTGGTPPSVPSETESDRTP